MPPQLRSQKAIIRENISKILTWVDEGYTLGSIHHSLKEDGIIKCGLSNFKRSYYLLRDSNKLVSTADSSSDTQLCETEQPLTEPELTEEGLIPITETSPISDDFDFDRQQRIAAAAFDKKRRL